MIDFLVEFWTFLRVRKKFWLAPLLIFMMLLPSLPTYVRHGTLKELE